MGYLFHILIALGAEGLGGLGVTIGLEIPWALALLLPVPHLLSWAGRKALLVGSFARAGVLSRVLHWSPPVLQLMLVCLFGWVQSARAWTADGVGVLAWPEARLLVSLAPFFVFEFLAIDAQARLHDSRVRERRAARSFQLRMFLSGLLPLALYLGFSGLVTANEPIRVHVEHVALFNALFVALLLSALALVLPLLIRNIWETTPMPAGPQRSLLEQLAVRASFRTRDLLVWRTGNLMANAAIVGVSPRSRVVLMSDSLLSILSMRELAAVFGHEMGHARRRHVWIFITWAIAFFLTADLAADALADKGLWWASASLIGILGGWVLSFGWMSRRFELDADLFSLELLGDPAGLILALERVGHRDRGASGWRHFSTQRRVEFILRAAGDPPWAARFRRRLRRWTVAGVLLAALAGALTLRGLLSSYPEDRVWAELSLGRFESASERAERVEAAGDLDADLLELARFAGRFVQESPAPDGAHQLAGLTKALVRSLGDGDLERAAGLADLAVLRGGDQLVPVSGALEALQEHDPARARELIEGAGRTWQDALAPWLARQ